MADKVKIEIPTLDNILREAYTNPESPIQEYQVEQKEGYEQIGIAAMPTRHLVVAIASLEKLVNTSADEYKKISKTGKKGELTALFEKYNKLRRLLNLVYTIHIKILYETLKMKQCAKIEQYTDLMINTDWKVSGVPVNKSSGSSATHFKPFVVEVSSAVQ